MPDIFATLAPMYKIIRYLGFAPYTIEGPPKRRYLKHSSKYALTSNIIHLVIIAYALQFYNLTMRSFNRESTLIYIASVANLLSVINFAIITVISSRLQNKRTISAWTRLYEVEKKFTKIGVRLNHNYLHKVSTVAVVPILVIFTFFHLPLVVFIRYSNGTFNLLTTQVCIVYYYMNLLQILTTVQFWVSFKILEHLFGELNRFASTKILRDCARELRSVTAIHQDLCKISRNFNQVLSVNVLFIFGTYFIAAALHLFHVVTSLFHLQNFDHYFALSCTLIIFYLSSLAGYILVSSQCMHQAGRIKKILFKILTKSDDPTLKIEIDAFSLQIIHEEFNITANGFFTIDFSLFTTIVGTLHMYIIILMQFDSSTNLRDTFFNRV